MLSNHCGQVYQLFGLKPHCDSDRRLTVLVRGARAALNAGCRSMCQRIRHWNQVGFRAKADFAHGLAANTL